MLLQLIEISEGCLLKSSLCSGEPPFLIMMIINLMSWTVVICFLYILNLYMTYLLKACSRVCESLYNRLFLHLVGNCTWLFKPFRYMAAMPKLKPLSLLLLGNKLENWLKIYLIVHCITLWILICSYSFSIILNLCFRFTNYRRKQRVISKQTLVTVAFV